MQYWLVISTHLIKRWESELVLKIKHANWVGTKHKQTYLEYHFPGTLGIFFPYIFMLSTRLQDRGKKPMETICSINEVLSQVIFKSSFFCFSILQGFIHTPGFDRQQLETSALVTGGWFAVFFFEYVST